MSLQVAQVSNYVYNYLDENQSNYTLSDGSTIVKTKNILPYLKDSYSIKRIHQLGIQGVPGFRFFINDELIQIGKSGIYVVSDIDFISLNFAVINGHTVASNSHIPISLNENIDYFLMDFTYEKIKEEE